MAIPFLLRLLSRFAALGALLAPLCASAAASPVLHLRIDGAIGPASAEFVSQGLDRARKAKAQLLVVEIDTPGGLDTSMRAIVKAILASPVPVAAFVTPQGARAASAGTFILYASHFAAMSPGTNLGAATPVAIGPGGPQKQPAGRKGEEGEDKAAPGDAMTAKQVNDAAAYIRSLAELRGRNAEWGVRAVREGASLSAAEALKEKVVDLMVPDLPALLAALDGREVVIAGTPARLATRGAPVQAIDPGWRTRLLQVIGDPSVALILMLIGFYGLIFEFGSPGFGVAGTVGAICLLLGLFALQMLPVSYAGLALILLGVALMIGEGLAPSFGILGAGGVVAFLLGGILLVREDEMPGFEVPLGLLAGLAAVTAAVSIVAMRYAIHTRRLPQRSGHATLVGQSARVLEVTPGGGWASIRGERWRVRSPEPLSPGDEVHVVAIDGLTLDVRRGTGHPQGG